MTPDSRLKVGTVAVGAVLILAGISRLFWAGSPAGPVGYAVAWLGFVAMIVEIVGGTLLVVVGLLGTTPTRHPMVRSVAVESQLSRTAVGEAIEQYITEAGGQLVESTEEHMAARFGSQLAVRLMGVSTQYGVDRLPYRVAANITESAAGSQLGLTLTSDEGWYLIRTKMHNRAYSARFDYVVAVLRSRISSTPHSRAGNPTVSTDSPGDA